MTHWKSILLGGSLLLFGCADLEQLAGMEMVMQVTEVWDSDGGTAPGLPSDELLDEDFYPSNDEPDHQVSFSDDELRVEIDDMTGDLNIDASDSLTYALTQGTTGDGRFVVWTEHNAYRAELTIYGSGRPVVQSERGKLVP